MHLSHPRLHHPHLRYLFLETEYKDTAFLWQPYSKSTFSCCMVVCSCCMVAIKSGVLVFSFEKKVSQVSDRLLTRCADGAPSEHRMTSQMAPRARCGCPMAFPSPSEVPITFPSHGSTSGGHMESYGAYRRKRYVLVHPRLHLPVYKNILLRIAIG